ncbi:glycogen debranching protein GlgX [Photobacterium sp. TLY01]|uniref:glycogen debranching protein GlgX n=1 Tax=Photobacterium sp. TLY01 TaxID=2907534 RepID=UPI001F195F48|nr:glycogen debranching protein GlgX [Photobacterium sp. TLY01]UIP30060.1 glycogen debranching protein GlgX [Photobacterium sp. TLY01]
MQQTDVGFGATLTSEGCHFCLYGPDILTLAVVLFDKEGIATARHPLQRQENDHWTVFIPGIGENTGYAFWVTTVTGPSAQWLLDPHAHRVQHHPARHSGTDRVAAPEWIAYTTYHDFDWQGCERPAIALEKMVLCEVHVKGYTRANPDLPAHLRGTYSGLCHPVTLAHFRQSGITSLQLMPIAAKADETHLAAKSLTNFWGYNPIAWSAPDERFASADPVRECKTMIRTLHAHGIEVILDVVYNHTAEEGNGGPVFHFKALDSQSYLKDEQGQFKNYTGCGNTLDLSHPPMLQAILQSLRSWVLNYQVDGFRFDLAATLGRNHDHFSSESAFFTAIRNDPVLSSVKLIAEPWDIGPDGYQSGAFPAGWHECNDQFRDHWRSFWLHDAPDAAIAPHLLGSQAQFPAQNWPQKNSINYICYHDGFTLQDLVSFNDRHNHANGENNRDGHPDNRSNNQGTEGLAATAAIQKRREKQKRNLMTSLLFSLGIPHLLGADLHSHSQQGNNNAYCQDNDTSWVNWVLSKEAHTFRSWLQSLIQLRQSVMPAIMAAMADKTSAPATIHWLTPAGRPMDDQSWAGRQPFSCLIQADDNHALFYLFNPDDHPVRFRLPSSMHNWTCLVDTAEQQLTVRNIQQSDCLVRPASMVILIPRP